MKTIVWTLNLLGGLGIFLYGLRVMSEALQKVAGHRIRSFLETATGNRFSATFAGFVATCVVQSSSATTVMVVTFCGAGLLNLTQSLGIIFGSNIGTTTTGWLVSLLGFKVSIAKFAVPMVGIGFFSQFIRRWHWPHRYGEILVGFGLLFLGLSLIKDFMPSLRESSHVLSILSFIQKSSGLGSLLLGILLGTVLTILMQSSSAMMAVTLAAAASGLIDYRTSAALVLGENIGTTITANLAAMGAPLTARQAARGHFLFNFLGAFWMIFIFDDFLILVNYLLPGNPYGMSENARLVALPTHIAGFHTLFNIINTAIFLPFIKPFENAVIFITPKTKDEEKPELRYITTPLGHAPELAIDAARKEIDIMAGLIVTILEKVKKIIEMELKCKPADVEELMKIEKKTDVLENQINHYLTDISHSHLSSSSNKEVHSLMSMANDLERMGDHGEKIAIIFRRFNEEGHKITEEYKSELNTMVEKATLITKAMKDAIQGTDENTIVLAREREEEINQLRYRLRESNYERLRNGKVSAGAGILFMDVLTSLEKMGDHAFNVVEATVGIK